MKFIKETIVELLSNSSKNRAAKELLMLSDKQLQDIGLSRAKLLEGASAYPWKSTEHVGSIADALVANDSSDQAVA